MSHFFDDIDVPNHSKRLYVRMCESLPLSFKTYTPRLMKIVPVHGEIWNDSVHYQCLVGLDNAR